MIRTAEILKLALRGTSFSGIYPGYKFRLGYAKLGKQEQKIWENGSTIYTAS